ncbi:MAG: hypothetical protein JSR45_01495 [Proteobacteria bacterium]|nr:hypothetical protein [Pseudomonadota bacterium]
MKKLMIAAAAALALSACATATPYAPAGPGHHEGYSEQRITADRYRVSFAGNSVTSRETVEMYLLYRAAEVTLQNGYDWFETADRSTQRDTRYVGTPDPFWGPYGPYWRPSWRLYRHGFWGPWGRDPWGPDYDVQQINRYEASAEIIMHHGPKPEGGPHAFDAHQVIENLGPRVTRPAPPK